MAKKVLIIDDDPDIVEAEKMILESRGYEVDSAGDGDSGLEKAREISMQFILLLKKHFNRQAILYKMRLNKYKRSIFAKIF